jgi:hypothetical protein
VKYTISRDGVPRTNRYVRIRLNRKQLRTLASFATQCGISFKELLELETSLMIDGLLSEILDGIRKPHLIRREQST